MIKFERNQLKNQKPQNSIGPKISPKMHENCEYNEKEGVKMSYRHLKTKTLRKFRKKTTKIDLKWIGQRRKERELFKKM